MFLTSTKLTLFLKNDGLSHRLEGTEVDVCLFTPYFPKISLKFSLKFSSTRRNFKVSDCVLVLGTFALSTITTLKVNKQLYFHITLNN
jgi:hypothetical protein